LGQKHVEFPNLSRVLGTDIGAKKVTAFSPGDLTEFVLEKPIAQRSVGGDLDIDEPPSRRCLLFSSAELEQKGVTGRGLTLELGQTSPELFELAAAHGTLFGDAVLRSGQHVKFSCSRQEFDINGVPVGAPAFIVNVTESPNYPGEVDLREFLSVWNQAWFSSLRAASGVYRYGRRTGNEDLMARARLTKEFTLAAPLHNGLFPTVYRTEMEKVEVGDKKVSRSKGWETGCWTNSNRVPTEHGITDRWYNVLDMSWTCLLLLRWHRELEEDPRILPYTEAYAERLLSLQDEEGFFPSWLDPDTEAPSPILAQSPQTSMSVTFLLALAEATGKELYREAALKAMDAVIEHIIPAGQWEDFETYWSCCRLAQDHLGRPFERNAMFKQCSFSMFWTAEALLSAWQVTNDRQYLDWGRRTATAVHLHPRAGRVRRHEF